MEARHQGRAYDTTWRKSIDGLFLFFVILLHLWSCGVLIHSLKVQLYWQANDGTPILGAASAGGALELEVARWVEDVMSTRKRHSSQV
eukprot:SAG11_NODE_15065_length_590_cov_1.048880_1_plen_88_part_00